MHGGVKDGKRPTFFPFFCASYNFQRTWRTCRHPFPGHSCFHWSMARVYWTWGRKSSRPQQQRRARSRKRRRKAASTPPQAAPQANCLEAPLAAACWCLPSRACCHCLGPAASILNPFSHGGQSSRRRGKGGGLHPAAKRKERAQAQVAGMLPAASSAARLHALGSFAQSPFCLPPRGQHAHEFSVCTRPWCPRFRTCPLAWTAGPATAERDFCPLWSRRTVMCGSTRLSNGGHSAGRKRSARMMMMSFICS